MRGIPWRQNTEEMVDDCLLQDTEPQFVTNAEMVDRLLNGNEAAGEENESTGDSLFSILAGPSTLPFRAHLHQLGHMLESGHTNETEDRRNGLEQTEESWRIPPTSSQVLVELVLVRQTIHDQ